MQVCLCLHINEGRWLCARLCTVTQGVVIPVKVVLDSTNTKISMTSHNSLSRIYKSRGKSRGEPAKPHHRIGSWFAYPAAEASRAEALGEALAEALAEAHRTHMRSGGGNHVKPSASSNKSFSTCGLCKSKGKEKTGGGGGLWPPFGRALNPSVPNGAWRLAHSN